MIVRRPAELPEGYTPVVGAGAAHPELGMEFGLLCLSPGQTHRDSRPLERAFLLLNGSARVEWLGGASTVHRASLLDERPSVIHAPAGAPIRVSAQEAGTEMTVHAVANETQFPVALVGPENTAGQTLGGRQASATRTLRTAIDDSTAPQSNMLLGEIVAPGWSSYPPHHHPHPEIYHYRFVPSAGFGFAELGEEAFKVRQRDTLAITPDLTHSQSTAPGYTMVYVWFMLHLPGNRFGTDSRQFVAEHAWAV